MKRDGEGKGKEKRGRAGCYDFDQLLEGSNLELNGYAESIQTELHMKE